MNKVIPITMLVIVTIVLTLVVVDVSRNYNILSNEELTNLTNAYYLQGALYPSQSGIIPYINNGTIGEITIEQICNLNTPQEVK
jgi:hypothetical protein